MKKEYLFLGLILALSLFLRVYKINELLNFNGDVARDYITARDITLKGIIPLVGCPSSVPWLHQGSLFLYLLGLVLWLGKYNPIAGGYFVAVMGVLGTGCLIILAKKLFSKEAGLWAGLVYACSPIIIYFDRYPYHQSLISFFTILFFLTLFKAIKNSKYFILSSFLFGLLMQLELSNLVLLPVLTAVILIRRKIIKITTLLFSLFIFLTTWTPKIIYDLTNGFSQTLGYLAWFLHKLSPIKFTFDNPSQNLPLVERLTTTFGNLAKIIFWPNIFVGFSIFVLVFLFFLVKLKSIRKSDFWPELLILLWLVFPLFGFIIQGSALIAYLPVIFGVFPILIGYFLAKIPKSMVKKLFSLTILIICFFNIKYLIKNNFFLLTADSANNNKMIYSQSYGLYKEMARYLVDTSDKEFDLVLLGDLAEFSSNKDSFGYLTWYFGKPLVNTKTAQKYFIYYNYDKNRYTLLNDSPVKEFPFMTIGKIND